MFYWGGGWIDLAFISIKASRHQVTHKRPSRLTAWHTHTDQRGAPARDGRAALPRRQPAAASEAEADRVKVSLSLAHKLSLKLSL